MTPVCALIVSYNRKELLDQCLEAVCGQTHPCARIIVIDNASTDGTAEFVAEKWGDRVEVHTFAWNIGSAGGFGTGLRIAYQTGAEMMWVMDDDVIPAPDALAKLVAAGELLDGRGSAWPFVVSVARTPRGVLCNVPGIDLRRNNIWAEIWPELLERCMIPVNRATFNSILLPRRTLERHGVPIKSMFIWGEDVEYTVRVVAAGDPGYVVGDSTCLHLRQIEGDLEIEPETEPRRIGYHYYRFRNMMLVRRMQGRWRFLNELYHNLHRALHLARHGDWLKARIVFSGTMHGLVYRPAPEAADAPFTADDPVDVTRLALVRPARQETGEVQVAPPGVSPAWSAGGAAAGRQ